MGCFGYMCSGCNEQIVGNTHKGGEHCVLIHKRHGVELGRTVGHYNEYGGVIEDALFRGDENNHPNSHSEICESEMMLADSHCFHGRMMVNGKSVRKDELKRSYINKVRRETTAKVYKETGEFTMLDEYDILDEWKEAGHEEKYQSFVAALEPAPSHSGIIAAHKVCFDKLSKEEQELLPFSETDPNQSWGEVNPLYA